MWGLLLKHLPLPMIAAGVAATAAAGLLLWEHLKVYWQFWVPALLIILNLFAFHGWEHEHELLTTEKLAHKADITNFAKAQAEANRLALSEKSILIKESKANADQADAKYSTLLASYRANLVRYQANQGGAQPAQRDQLPAPQGSDGPSGSTDLPAATITITLDDAGRCAANTARLQAVHDWAVALPKETK